MVKLKVSHQALYGAKWSDKGVVVGTSDHSETYLLQLCRTFGILHPFSGPVVAWVVDFDDNPLTKEYEIRKVAELTEEEQGVLSAVWHTQGRHRWLK